MANARGASPLPDSSHDQSESPDSADGLSHLQARSLAAQRRAAEMLHVAPEALRGAPDHLRGAVAMPVLWFAGALEAVAQRAAGSSGRELSGPGILVKGVFYPVRTLTADDTELLWTFLQHGLSEESRRRRFMAPMPQVPTTAAAWLASRDGHSRVALAVLDPVNLGTIVAVVEYAMSPDGPPEVAVAVADDYHGRGIGTNVLSMLATMSLAAGESSWRCDVLADNDAPLRLLAAVGDVELGGVSGGVRSVIVHLDPDKLLGTTALA